MISYKLHKNSFGVETMVISNAGLWIPFDPTNTDAQQFVKWLQDGNVPEAAEEGGTVSPEWVAETITKLLPNG